MLEEVGVANQAWWRLPVILAFGRQRLEVPKFNVILGYIICLGPTWAI